MKLLDIIDTCITHKGNNLLHHAVALKNKNAILCLLLNEIDPMETNKKNFTVYDLQPDMNVYIDSIYQVT